MTVLQKPFETIDNLLAGFWWKLESSATGPATHDLGSMSPSMQQCHDLLNKTGRAFGFMTSVLDRDLRDAVSVFYLVTRAIDTFEDDMSIPADVKVTHLNSFSEHLIDPAWRFTDSKDEYAVVLENFPTITQALRCLPKKYSEVILELCPLFAQNLVPFLGKEVATMKDLHEYSHNAGTSMCIAVLRLFAASGLEDEAVVQDTWTINEFSLFLHKINFIKDFWKDWNSGKLFWPKELWSKYTSCPGNFLKPENRETAVECLNDMVLSAIEHLPRFLSFMGKFKNEGTRKFYAMNKVMAIASLELCYNNPEVFTKSVKITRSETAKIIRCSSTPDKVLNIVRHYTLKIIKRANQDTPNSARIREVCLQILRHEDMQQLATSRSPWRGCVPCFYVTSAAAVAVVSFACWYLGS